jgi:uncharacterized membrane protein
VASYKERVAQDIDRWIAAGLAPASSRTAMLDAIREGRRLDAATALAWVGMLLAGAALIAFIGANWDALPRIAKFALILGVYAGAAGAGAWCLARARPNAANALIMFAALAFGACIGLTGQIFDIAGDERTALYASGGVAAVLALAGRSSGAAIAALFFAGAGDFAAQGLFAHLRSFDFGWLIVAAPAASALAFRWRSVPLALAAGLGVGAAAVWLATKTSAPPEGRLALAVALAALAAGARSLRERDRACAGVLYGWLTWAAAAFFASAGFELGHPFAIAHRLAWLLLGGGLVTLGRLDRHALMTAAGVLSLIGAISAVMYDLGLGLMAAAAVFLAAALIAGLGGLALRRRAA